MAVWCGESGGGDRDQTRSDEIERDHLQQQLRLILGEGGDRGRSGGDQMRSDEITCSSSCGRSSAKVEKKVRTRRPGDGSESKVRRVQGST